MISPDDEPSPLEEVTEMANAGEDGKEFSIEGAECQLDHLQLGGEKPSGCQLEPGTSFVKFVQSPKNNTETQAYQNLFKQSSCQNLINRRK